MAGKIKAIRGLRDILPVTCVDYEDLVLINFITY